MKCMNEDRKDIGVFRNEKEKEGEKVKEGGGVDDGEDDRVVGELVNKDFFGE